MNSSFEQLLSKVSENPNLREEELEQVNSIDDMIAIAIDLVCSNEESDMIR